MTQRTFVKCIQAQTQEGTPLRLEYYLLTDYASFDGGALDLYGVEVLLYRPGMPQPERCRIRGITPVGAKALQLLQRLTDGAVTPATVRDVVEDYLADPASRRHGYMPRRPYPMR